MVYREQGKVEEIPSPEIKEITEASKLSLIADARVIKEKNISSEKKDKERVAFYVKFKAKYYPRILKDLYKKAAQPGHNRSVYIKYLLLKFMKNKHDLAKDTLVGALKRDGFVVKTADDYRDNTLSVFW